MSLDVYLEGSTDESRTGIFIREAGQTREILREEWDEKFPGKEPIVAIVEGYLFTDNITHNLGKMAAEAELYYPIWRPDEIGITKAHQLIEPLKNGLNRLVANPDKFKKYNPSNGWGSYELLVRWVQTYLQACEQFPDAHVKVSR